LLDNNPINLTCFSPVISQSSGSSPARGMVYFTYQD
jgi:hypothetical protein